MLEVEQAARKCDGASVSGVVSAQHRLGQRDRGVQTLADVEGKLLVVGMANAQCVHDNAIKKEGAGG